MHGKKISTDEIWQAIHDDPTFVGDPDEAVARADAVVKLLKRGQTTELENLRQQAEQEAERHNRLVRNRRKAIMWWVVSITFFLALVGGLAYSINWAFANDRSGMDQKNAGTAAQDAARYWYGANEIQGAITTSKPEPATLDGREVWRVRFASANDKKGCAYVWGDPDNYQETLDNSLVKDVC
jgi:hypothetical protein